MAIITISRGSMSGGEALANCLGATLGYPVLAREVLIEAAARLGVSEELLREKIQTTSGGFEKLREDRRIYLLALQSALADRCVSGNLIYHGNAGHLLLKGLPTLLRVRLIASIAARVRAVVERQGLDPEPAREYIKYVDQERVEWNKFVYGVDWRDPKNYDLVVNLRNVSLQAACVMISSVVMLPTYTSTPEVKKQLQDFALACRVQLALAVDPGFRGLPFAVHADGGKVEISWQAASGAVGARPAQLNKDLIRHTAILVEGVREVTLLPERIEPLPQAG